MAKCSSCGRDVGFAFGKKLCRWCVEHEAAQRGENSEIQRVMPTPWKAGASVSSASFTQLFTFINVAVFVAMVVSGISLTNPSSQQLIHWGANFGPLTMSTEPWRLFTYMFLHIGIIHIGLNMWCLWSLGGLAESLYGDWLFAVIYITCGFGAGIASVAWRPGGVSAGASGAIFGIVGALIASLRLGEFSLPRTVIYGTLRSVLVFAVYSLGFGFMSGHTDNAAHIGGLVTGLVLGALVALIAPDRDHVFRRIAICAVVLMIVAGCAQWTLHARGFITFAQRGNMLLAQGKTDEAIAELQRAIKKRPNYAQSHFMLAHAFAIKGQLPAAKLELKRAAELEPNNQWTWYELGLMSLRQHQPDEAQQAFLQMLRIDQKNAEGHLGLGFVADAQSRSDEAIAEYKKAAELDGESGAYYSLGVFFSKTKRYDEAIAAFTKQQQIVGDDQQTETALAEAYRAKGMIKEADEALQKAAQLKQSDQ